MASKQKEKTPLSKTNWTQQFTLVGKAIVNDYTFKLDEHSNKSDWIYNQLNLNVDCGEHSGKVSAEMMGGYGSERNNNVIYVHGKNEDNSDDFKNQYTIDWVDRFDESILEDIGSTCFINIGLEKDVHDKTVVKRFLTPYDAIAYVSEHLEDGMVINVRGQLRYQLYNGNVQCRKEINSIFLSKAEPDAYRASFVQTMLLDKDSAGKSTIDKDKRVMYVNAYILEKFKEFNGWDLTENGKIKGGIFVPLRKTFEFDLNGKEPTQTAKLIDKVFKVKKGVTQITFEGEFVETGAAVTATEDDLTDDVKDMIDCGFYTLEEALAKCSTNGARERKMMILKPQIRMVGDDDNKTSQVQIFPEQFAEEDLQLDCLVPRETEDDDEVPFEEAMNAPEETSSEEADDLAALLNALG